MCSAVVTGYRLSRNAVVTGYILSRNAVKGQVLDFMPGTCTAYSRTSIWEKTTCRQFVAFAILLLTL